MQPDFNQRNHMQKLRRWAAPLVAALLVAVWLVHVRALHATVQLWDLSLKRSIESCALRAPAHQPGSRLAIRYARLDSILECPSNSRLR